MRGIKIIFLVFCIFCSQKSFAASYQVTMNDRHGAGMIGLLIVDNDYSNIVKMRSSNAPVSSKIKLHSLLKSLP